MRARLRYAADDVVRNVKRQQENREQGRDDQDCALLHSVLLVFDSAPVESERAQHRGAALPCDEHDVRARADVVRRIEAEESRLGLVNSFPGTCRVVAYRR